VPTVVKMTSTRGRTRRRERRVLREEICDQLIDDIVSGRLAPGERIIEARLAEEFSVSQAPVREALRDLNVLGFVESSPFRGAVVRQISVEELLQLYPIRAVLEGLAAREAAVRIRPAGLRNFTFHLTIVEASENRLLLQIWDRMRLATTTSLTVSKSHHSLVEIAERHEGVLAALRAHDPVAAEQAMRRHIEEPWEWMQTALAEEADRAKQEDAGRTAKRRRAHRK
jgi:DNA-binding GntR family transcriptional regulator